MAGLTSPSRRRTARMRNGDKHLATLRTGRSHIRRPRRQDRCGMHEALHVQVRRRCDLDNRNPAEIVSPHHDHRESMRRFVSSRHDHHKSATTTCVVTGDPSQIHDRGSRHRVTLDSGWCLPFDLRNNHECAVGREPLCCRVSAFSSLTNRLRTYKVFLSFSTREPVMQSRRVDSTYNHLPTGE